jgi:hypothetical protein
MGEGHWRGVLSAGIFVPAIPVCWIATRAARWMLLGAILSIFLQRSATERRNPIDDA